MRRWVAERVTGSAVMLVLGTVGAAFSQEAQGGAPAEGPRFLMASTAPSPRGAPRPLVAIDVEQIPVLGRRIALDLDGATLKEALAAISSKAKLDLLYGDDVVPLRRRVRLRASAITVAGALTDVLLGTGVDVVFNRDGGASLVPRSGAGAARGQGRAAPVSGRVVAGDTKAPLRGASVTVALADSALSAMTGDSGTFAFSDVPAGEHSVTVRYIGYRPLSKKVVVRDTATRVDFVLEPRAVALDELVATATGRQRRRDLGNAITTIKADSVMRNAPIRNLTDLLDDRVPGLTVQHTSGAPGDPARLRLRGLGSILRSNDPVVYVDGVRVYAAQSEARSGNLTNRGDFGGFDDANRLRPGNNPAPSPLDQIDPNTIETIDVFKGPSAATQYGADAANGVIVITTKRGKPGPTRWEARLTHGRTTTPGRWPEGYFRWGRELVRGYGPKFCTLSDRSCVQDSLTRYQALNDPELTLFGRGRRSQVSLSASGGTQALTYNLTGTYGTETGLLRLPVLEAERFRERFRREPDHWMRRPHEYTSWSVTSNVTSRLGATADVTLRASLTRSEQQRTSLENQVAPMAGTYVDKATGTYFRPATTSNAFSGGYVLDATDDALQDYFRRTTASTVTFNTGLDAKWEPRSWLTITGQAGVDIVPRIDEMLLPAGLTTGNGFSSIDGDSGAISRGTGRSVVGTFNLQGSAVKSIGRGFRLRAAAGANLLTSTTDDLVTSAYKLVPGTSAIAGARVVSATDAQANSSIFGWYVEPQLVGERIAISTGVRLDGGSAYGARLTRSGGGLFGLLSLPHLGGSWVISEEPFFPFKSLFSSLRLRGSYGQAQRQPGAADRLRLYDQSVRLTHLGNTQIRPERSTEIEGGFDADLLDSRLSVELALYRKTVTDALVPVALPSSVFPGGQVLTNIGRVRNTGVELTVDLTPVRSSAVTWHTQLNYTRNRNKLMELAAGVLPNPAQGVVAGYPLAGRWAAPIVGYIDANGDNVIEYSEVRIGSTPIYLGPLYPSYTSSVQSNLRLFGAVGISVGFSYDHGGTQLDRTAQTNWVLARALVDPSTPLNEQAAVVAATTRPLGDNAPRTDYGLIQSVSTFRFNSLSVSYDAPTRIAKLLRAQRLTFAVQGSNLGLHSSYRGMDPDVNSWSPGENIVDTGQIPQPRTWQIAAFLSY